MGRNTQEVLKRRLRLGILDWWTQDYVRKIQNRLVVRPLQSENAMPPTLVTLSGMVTLVRLEQLLNVS